VTTSHARQLLGAALFLGVSGDLLISPENTRLGLAVWLVLIVGVAWWCRTMRPPGVATETTASERGLLLAIIVLAAISSVVRDSERLVVLAAMLSFGAAALVIWTAQGFSLASLRLTDGFVAARLSLFTTLTGVVPLALSDANWGADGTPSHKNARLTLIGTLVALPLIAVTATLLGEADPIFGSWVERLTGFISVNLGEHVIGSFLLMWVTAGWLRGSVRPRTSRVGRIDLSAWRVEMAALAPALYAMIIVFAAFIGLQARTLISGAAYVERTTGLSYAEYARGGFFELVGVTMIVLGVLLLADEFLDRKSTNGERRFRSASWMLLALVAMLAASAAYRMSLYVNAYGLSEDRLFALAGMLWIGVALGWFGWTVLRGRREVFPVGLVAWTVGWVFALNVLLPDALVARVNLSRARAGLEFDVAYHATQLPDAVPVLVEGAGDLPQAQCRELLVQLSDRSAARASGDWRRWSLATARARRALAPGVDALVTQHCGRV